MPSLTVVTVAVDAPPAARRSPASVRRCTSLAPGTPACVCVTVPSLTKYTLYEPPVPGVVNTIVFASSTPGWPAVTVSTSTVTGAGASRSACTTTSLTSSTPGSAACACVTVKVDAAGVALTLSPSTGWPSSAPMNSIS